MQPVDSPKVFSDRYELTHLIARGGMAEVYRARDRLLDRPVALKVLFPELSVDRAFVERFRREAQAAANLSHPNIVPVFDWGEDTGTYFIVMEFIDGRPLSALLRASGPLAPQRAADIGAHVAAALAYAHRHGVIHRDVKPGNVLITNDGQVKVTDFGIARAVNTEESLTQTGAVMGTAAYFSPEQAEGIGVDARSDVYSLGVVLFEMITGRPPFLGDTPVSVASKHVRDQPPLPRDLRPDVPIALESVVMKAMAKLPDQRYASADDLRTDLIRYLEGRPVVATEPTVVGGWGTATGVMDLNRGTSENPAISSTQVVPGRQVAASDPGGPLNARPRRRQKGNRGLLFLLLLLLAALAIVAYLLVNTLSGGFALPNLVGQSVAQATSTLEAKGLSVGTTTQKQSSKAPGTVLSTDPSAGATVKKGDKVNLVLSKALPNVSVPSVVGDQFTAAEVLLSSQHLRSHVNFVNTGGSQNVVLSQSPAAGASVPRQTIVQLNVPTPNSSVVVPGVQGESPTQATNDLQNAGLQVGNRDSACSNSVSSGLVSGTSPAQGTSVQRNTSVTLIVSSGSCQVVVQNVVGQSQGSATSTLSGQGLTVNTNTLNPGQEGCDSSNTGNVLAQDPAGGTQVTLPATATIDVCSAGGTSPTSTTTTTTSSP